MTGIAAPTSSGPTCELMATSAPARAGATDSSAPWISAPGT